MNIITKLKKLFSRKKMEEKDWSIVWPFAINFWYGPSDLIHIEVLESGRKVVKKVVVKKGFIVEDVSSNSMYENVVKEKGNCLLVKMDWMGEVEWVVSTKEEIVKTLVDYEFVRLVEG